MGRNQGNASASAQEHLGAQAAVGMDVACTGNPCGAKRNAAAGTGIETLVRIGRTAIGGNLAVNRQRTADQRYRTAAA